MYIHNVIAFIGSLRKESVHRQVYNFYKELAKNDFNFTDISVGADKEVNLWFKVTMILIT